MFLLGNTAARDFPPPDWDRTRTVATTAALGVSILVGALTGAALNSWDFVSHPEAANVARVQTQL